jgi:5-methylcytosine-specific restriction endonuclease McrA
MAKRPPRLNQRKSAGKRTSNWSQPYRKSAAERGYGSEWRKKRRRIIERDKGLCQPCLRQGRTTLATEVDHKIPKAEGGTDDDENLEAICDQVPFRCHSIKTAKESQRAAKKAAGVLVGGVAVNLNKKRPSASD